MCVCVYVCVFVVVVVVVPSLEACEYLVVCTENICVYVCVCVCERVCVSEREREGERGREREFKSHFSWHNFHSGTLTHLRIKKIIFKITSQNTATKMEFFF